MGLLSGIFMDAGGSVTNGIAHFGGFITSLVVLFVFDIRTEERRYFDTMLGTAILIGIFWYGYYLVNLIKVVKG
jgi:membrane associated rhomboid family serine protease